MPVTGPSSNSTQKNDPSRGLIKAFLIFSAISLIILLLWFLGIFKTDPYVTETLTLKGSLEKGDRIFRMNCVGCHGISGQGLLGPDLHGVSSNFNNAEIINQVIKGRTPPMPRFEIEPQAMADLLEYLHSLN